MKTFTCDICNAPMKMIKKTRPIGKSYRKRKFECTICDFSKTIYADGWLDEVQIPKRGINEVKKNYKQEEDNSLGRAI